MIKHQSTEPEKNPEMGLNVAFVIFVLGQIIATIATVF